MIEKINCNHRFLSVARVFNRMVDSTLKRSRLSASRFQILLLIAGSPRGQIASSLAAQASLSTKTLSFHLGHLEADGLIKRTIDKDDRRSYRFSITPQGKQKIDRLTPTLTTLFQTCWIPLSQDEINKLNQVLVRLGSDSPAKS